MLRDLDQGSKTRLGITAALFLLAAFCFPLICFFSNDPSVIKTAYISSIILALCAVSAATEIYFEFRNFTTPYSFSPSSEQSYKNRFVEIADAGIRDLFEKKNKRLRMFLNTSILVFIFVAMTYFSTNIMYSSEEAYLLLAIFGAVSVAVYNEKKLARAAQLIEKNEYDLKLDDLGLCACLSMFLRENFSSFLNDGRGQILILWPRIKSFKLYPKTKQGGDFIDAHWLLELKDGSKLKIRRTDKLIEKEQELLDYASDKLECEIQVFDRDFNRLTTRTPNQVELVQ